MHGNMCKNDVFEPQVDDSEEECENILINFEKILKAKNDELRHILVMKMRSNEEFIRKVVSKTSEIVKLETKLNATEAAKNKAENQIILFEEVYQKLDAQRNQTFIARFQQMENTIEMKLKEIFDLTTANQITFKP